MIDPLTYLSYVLIVLGFVFIPGPATVMTVARSTSSGTKVGLATAFGIAVGDLIHTALAVVGISAILVASALMFTIVKYLGAAYLIYLGVKALLTASPSNTTTPSKKLTPKQAFHQGVLAEVLNPKTALFFLAFLPQFVNPNHGLVPLQLTILGVTLVLAGLISTCVFALTAGQLGAFLRRHPIVLQWQDKVVGGIYCALGLRLVFQER